MTRFSIEPLRRSWRTDHAQPDLGLADGDLDPLRADLGRALSRPEAQARAAQRVREIFGRDLDGADPAGHVAWLCVARCAARADDAAFEAPSPDDAPGAARELREGLDLIRRWTGADSGANARLRRAVAGIEDALLRDPDEAHGLLMELWSAAPGETSTKRYTALGVELRDTLLAAGLTRDAASRHAAWLVERVCGGPARSGSTAASLGAQIRKRGREIDDLDAAIRRLEADWQGPKFGGAGLASDARAPRARRDDLRREVGELKAKRAWLLRFALPTAGAIERAGARQRKKQPG